METFASQPQIFVEMTHEKFRNGSGFVSDALRLIAIVVLVLFQTI